MNLSTLVAQAIAAWGDTSTLLSRVKNISVPWPIGPDGRGGNQPRGMRILDNIVQVVVRTTSRNADVLYVQVNCPMHLHVCFCF